MHLIIIMDNRRQHKVSKLIQREMSEIFQQDTKNMFGSLFISVTDVTVSPDLGIAKIWLSLLQKQGRDQAFDMIMERKPEIRKILGNRIGKQVRKIPELQFYLDEGQEHAQRINDILKNLDIPKEDNDE